MMKIYSFLFTLILISTALEQDAFKILIHRLESVVTPSHKMMEFHYSHLRKSASPNSKITENSVSLNVKYQNGERDKIYIASVANRKIPSEYSAAVKTGQSETNAREDDLLYTSEKINLREKELEDIMITAKRWNSLLFVLSSLLVIFVLLLLYSLRLLSKNKKKIELQKQSIFAKNAVLKRNVQEKEFLVRELNHRVKNNLAVILSLVGFQKDETHDPLYKHKFEQLYSRINTISLGHNLFSYHVNSFDKSTVEIKAYSQKIFESHKAGFPSELKIETDLQQVHLPVDKGLSYGLLLNELLTNSLKHAVPAEGQPLKISLIIKENNGTAEMRYCDNGLFFGNSDDSNSLGHFIIDAMVQQLDGSFEREQSCYHIVFSLAVQASPEAERIIALMS